MARYWFDSFSIAVTGRGRLVGPFVTEAFNRFQSATIYMRTPETNAARQAEVALGKSQFASKNFRKMALATEKNLRNPPAADVTVDFKQEGDSETVWIKGKVYRRMVSLRWDKIKDLSDMDKAVAKILDAVLMVP